MTHANRSVAGFAALVLCAVVLVACGDSEADQRKAFIEFLQSRIIDKSGSHVPRLTADEAKPFGPYAEHYALIPSFNDEMTKAMAGANKISQTAAPTSIQDLVNRRQEIKAMVEAMTDTAAQARKNLADFDVKRAALKQPDDLKTVYALAYERTVTTPAQTFLATIPVAVDGLKASLQLADYLDAHRATIRISGSSIQAADNKTRADIAQLLSDVKSRNDRLNEARRHLRQVTTGD